MRSILQASNGAFVTDPLSHCRHRRPLMLDRGRALLAPICLLFLLALAGCSGGAEGEPERFSFRVLGEYPHDPLAFTQGLAWDGGEVYEGTGRHGGSSLRRVDLATGQVERAITFEREVFAEGITVYGERIYQLTWKNGVVFVFDKEDLSLLATRPYPREGWGITHDGESLIASDGTSTLYFLDPGTLAERRRVAVRDLNGEVALLNELEYVEGRIYANVWKSDRIAIIDPENGRVEGWVELGGLRRRLDPGTRAGVLNGIMFDPGEGRLFVTGKFWPRLFEIRLVPGP